MICLNCSKNIIQKYPSVIRRFCSNACVGKYYGEKRKGSGNPHWKGGVSNFNGYWMITHGKEIYKLQHRKVMEEKLGRKLTKEEIVHHKNGNKKDNNPKNLEIMTRAEHQRHHRPHLNYCKYFVQFNGETKSISQWCRELNLSYANVFNRINNCDWSVQKAFQKQ